MKQLNFKQGTPEWAAWRATVDSASDAPAMLDEMPQKTRNKLVEEYATGFKAEHSDFIKDVVFPNGHRIEALLRPFAEKFWEDDLFPTCVEKNVGLPRPLGASLDGQSMDCATNWECKSMNDEIRKTSTAEDLPVRYRIQMEQGLEASGAVRCIFSAGSFDKDGNMTEEKHFLYLTDLELRSRILSGWAQFHKDVAAWIPKAITEPPKAEEIIQLPSVTVLVSGALRESNLNEVTPLFDKYLAGTNTTLATDEDFANGEANGKFSRATAKTLKAKAKEVIDQIATVSDAVRTLELYAGKFDALGLKLEKAVTEQKSTIKLNISMNAAKSFREHVAALEKDIAPVRLVTACPFFDEVMKNQRTIASLHNKVDSALAFAKGDAHTEALSVLSKLAWLKSLECKYDLFRDLQTLIQKPIEDFQLMVNARIAEQVAREAEAIKAAVARAEIAKAEAEAAAKAAAQVAQPVQQPAETARQPVQASARAGQPIQAQKNASAVEFDEVTDFLKSAQFKTQKDAALVKQYLLAFVNYQQSRKGE